MGAGKRARASHPDPVKRRRARRRCALQLVGVFVMELVLFAVASSVLDRDPDAGLGFWDTIWSVDLWIFCGGISLVATLSYWLYSRRE